MDRKGLGTDGRALVFCLVICLISKDSLGAPAGFVNEVYVSGLTQPTQLVPVPDGRMFIVHRQGAILVLPAGATTLLSQPLLQIANVYAEHEAGVLSSVLAPDFQTTGHYYVYYTRANPQLATLSRFTVQGNSIDPHSEIIIWQDTQIADRAHHGGTLLFGPDGKLYLSTGDNQHPTDSQSLRSARGKMLRLNPDGTIPEDNPFLDGEGPNKDEVWAYGLRNPFRGCIDPETGRIFIGDVGGNVASTAVEEVHILSRGANYGWPICESDCTPDITKPLYSYPQTGISAAVIAGFVYRGTHFPSEYIGSFFFADYARRTIKRLTVDDHGHLVNVFNFEPADGSTFGPYGDICDLRLGNDGMLYYLDFGGGLPGNAKIRRIRNTSNLTPKVVASATPEAGEVPLTVSFSSLGSTDPEGAPLTYLWDFGNGDSSTAANPTYVYQSRGSYTARLRLSDGRNNVLSDPITINVGTPPVATITSPSTGLFFEAGDTITFNGTGTAADGSNLPASAFEWTVLFKHASHHHPIISGLRGTKSGQFLIETSGHDYSGNTSYEIELTVTDSNGLKHTDLVMVLPKKVNLHFTTEPPALKLIVNGLTRTTPFTLDALLGFENSVEAPPQPKDGRNYHFTSWAHGGAASQTITTPSSEAIYTARFEVGDLILSLGFDEGGGLTTADAAAPSSPAALVNGPGWTTGKAGPWAVVLDGQDDYVLVNASPVLNAPREAVTVCAWVYRTANQAGWRSIVSRQRATGDGEDFGLFLVDNKYSFLVTTDAGIANPTGSTAPLNQWFHLAGTYDGSKATLYVNGIEQISSPLTGPFTGANPITVGGNVNAGAATPVELFKGHLDELRIYDRALSAAEILALVDPAAPVLRSLAVQSVNPANGVAVTVSPLDVNNQGSGTAPFNRTYPDGTEVALSAPATVGVNLFEKWQTNGVDFSTSPAINVTLRANDIVTAVYVTPQRRLPVESLNPDSLVEITVSPPDVDSLGDGTTPFDRTYVHGSLVNLSAPTTAGANTFQKWQTNGVDYSTSPTTNLEINADYTVTAVYTSPGLADITVQSLNPPSGVAVTVSPPDANNQGNGTTPFNRSFIEGTLVNLTAPATAGINTFQTWRTNGVVYSSSPAITLTLNGIHTATAVYATPARALNIQSINPASGVAITVSALDLNNQGNGTTPFSRSYSHGSVVNLIAPATAGVNIFQKWQTNGVDYTTSPTTNLVLNGNYTVTAVYLTPNRLLTVESSDPNTGVAVTVAPVDKNGTGNGTTPFNRTYSHGTTVTLTAPATAAGNGFQKWQTNGVDYTTLRTTNIVLNGNYTLKAVYGNPASGTLVNGSFESGYTGWTAVGNQGIATGSPYEPSDRLNLIAFNWGQTTPNGVLSQSVPTVSGLPHTLRFDLGVLAYNFNEQRLRVTVQGSSTLLSQTLSIAGTGNGITKWVPQSFTFTANSGSVTIRFEDLSPSTQNLDLLLDNVRLSAQTSPTITSQPSNVTVGTGESATFSVVAAGQAPLAYQWRFNTSPIIGATASSYTINNAQPANGGSYDVIVSNGSGSETSSTATLAVIQAGAFVNGSFESGYNGWTVTGNQGVASGAPYQASDGVRMAAFNWGQTTPNGVLSQSFTTVAGQSYRLGFDLGVLAYNFNEQRLQVAVQGSTTLLSQTLSISGLGNGTTRWTPQSFTFTANSTTTTLTFRDLSSTTLNLDLLLDRVQITSENSPNITSQPANSTVVLNAAVTFSVTATGQPPLAYQWRFQRAPITGANGASYTISHAQLVNSGEYDVIVSNGSGTITSSAATLTVIQPGGLVNGSFESDFAGWTATGSQGIAGPKSFPASDGTRVVAFNWGQEPPNGLLSQGFTTTPGQGYRLQFDLGVSAYNFNEQRLQVSVVGSSTLLSQTLSIFGIGSGVTKWVPQSFTFTANSGTSTLNFRDVSASTDSLDLLLDNIRVTPTAGGATLSFGDLIGQPGSPVHLASIVPLGNYWKITMFCPLLGKYQVENSQDLVAWKPIQRLDVVNPGMAEVTVTSQNTAAAFYRVVLISPNLRE